MGEDEAQTVKTLTIYRKIVRELIHQHRGRVIDSPGEMNLEKPSLSSSYHVILRHGKVLVLL
jgi:hypothetical protein